MIFTMPVFNASFETIECQIPIFVIENKSMYQSFVMDLMRELDGIQSENVFYVNDKEVVLKKDLELLLDIFSIDVNKAKNLTKLYNYIKSNYINEEKYLETAELISEILKYIASIVGEIDYHLIYDENIDLQSILKILNLRFYYEETTILEKLIDYVKIMHGFFDKKLFVILNFKSLFSEEEQLEFYKFLSYSKIDVFIVESTEPTNRLNGEKYRIIDKDLCVIY